MASEIISTSEQGLIALICLGIHLSYFFLVKTFVPFFGKDRRNLSWLLTLVSAATLSVGSFMVLAMHTRTTLSRTIPYEEYSHTPGVGFYRYDIAYTPTVFEKQTVAEAVKRLDKVALDPSLIQAADIAVQDQVSLAEARIAFYKEYDRVRSTMPWHHRAIFFDTRFQPADSRAGQYINIFFAAYLLTDLLCGVRYYKEKITVLGGWVHHLVYLFISFYASTVGGEAHSMSACMLIEVPTVIIGLGFINKQLRNDKFFGLSYFVFRILFDFALMHEYIYGRPCMVPATKMMGIFKSLLHVKFFYDWFHQQSRLRKRMAFAADKMAIQPSGLDVKEASSSESSALQFGHHHNQDQKPMPALRLRATVKKSERREQGGITVANTTATTLSIQETTMGSRHRIMDNASLESRDLGTDKNGRLYCPEPITIR